MGLVLGSRGAARRRRQGEKDRALVESVQRGVVSGVVDRGRLLPESERLIALFHTKVTLSLTEGAPVVRSGCYLEPVSAKPDG